MGSILVPNAPQSGRTLLATGTLSGANLVLSSIPTSYSSLYVIIRNFKPATDNQSIRLEINGDSTASRYANAGTFSATAQTYGQNYWTVTQNNDNSVAIGLTELEFVDYANTTTAKMMKIQSHTVDPTTTTSYCFYSGAGVYNQTAAITQLGFFTSSGNFTSGTLLLYGVK